MKPNAQIYRLRDKAAIALPGAPVTIYAGLEDAKAIRRALGRVIRSIEREPFTESHATHVLQLQRTGPSYGD